MSSGPTIVNCLFYTFDKAIYVLLCYTSKTRIWADILCHDMHNITAVKINSEWTDVSACSMIS